MSGSLQRDTLKYAQMAEMLDYVEEEYLGGGRGGRRRGGLLNTNISIGHSLSASLLLTTMPDAPARFIQLGIEVISPRIHSTVYELIV